MQSFPVSWDQLGKLWKEAPLPPILSPLWWFSEGALGLCGGYCLRTLQRVLPALSGPHYGGGGRGRIAQLPVRRGAASNSKLSLT